MAKKLKHILLKIARLPASDQRWILGQLSSAQMEQLNQYQGLDLLESAQRFRKLKAKHIALPPFETPQLLEASEPLPAYCEELATRAPLYAAVVIEQGAYPWESLFLHQFDHEGLIKRSLETQVPDLKPLVKSTLFSEWESRFTFEDYLEPHHG